MLNISPRFFVRFILSVLPFTGLSGQDRGSPAVGAMPIVRQSMPIVRQSMPIVRQPTVGPTGGRYHPGSAAVKTSHLGSAAQKASTVGAPQPPGGRPHPGQGTQKKSTFGVSQPPEGKPQVLPDIYTPPRPEIHPQPPREAGFLQLGQNRQIRAASDQTNAQLVNTIISPNGAYTAVIVRDGAELHLYLQKGGSYTLVAVCNTIEGVTWSKDSSTVRFRATKAVGLEKVEEREVTYQPATQVLKWRVMRIST